MPMTSPFSERTTFWIVLGISICCSVGWFAGCIALHEPREAGRGGNVGLVVALLFSFVNRNGGAERISAWAQKWKALDTRLDADGSHAPAPAPPPTVETIHQRLDLLVQEMRLDTEGRARETAFLVAATLVGTALAGFGDWLAAAVLAAIG
jgi:hypothetical protein